MPQPAANALDRARRRLLGLLLSTWLVASCLLVTSARAEAAKRIPVVVHVAQREGQAVAPPEFIAEQLSGANELFVPLGIELVERERVPMAGHVEMVTRADRDALSPYVAKGAVHIFVVGKLMDVDEPGLERRGVHWHPRKKSRLSYVIVSQISKRYVLAHELGHYFGNREHSDVPGNLMSYTRTERPPFLNDAQIQRIRRSLAASLENGTLQLAPPPAPPPAP